MYSIGLNTPTFQSFMLLTLVILRCGIWNIMWWPLVLMLLDGWRSLVYSVDIINNHADLYHISIHLLQCSDGKDFQPLTPVGIRQVAFLSFNNFLVWGGNENLRRHNTPGVGTPLLHPNSQNSFTSRTSNPFPFNNLSSMGVKGQPFSLFTACNHWFP